MGLSRTTGLRCNNLPVKGRRFCRMHGANIPTGLDHPKYKHGKYATVGMPKSLAEKYEITRTDTKIVELGEEIHLADAMIMDALERIGKREGADAWKLLSGAVKDFWSAKDAGKPTDMMRAMQDIDEIVVKGSAAHSARKDLQSWLETRRKLTESEIRRRTALGDMINRAQALVLIDKMVGLVQDHVDDHRIKSRLSTALLELASASHAQ